MKRTDNANFRDAYKAIKASERTVKVALDANTPEEKLRRLERRAMKQFRVYEKLRERTKNA